MNVSRFLLLAILVTTLALGYVHQQVELLRINYAINYNKGDLLVLLDQNSTLMYNVTSLQSPLYLEKRLIGREEVSWEVPFRWHTIGAGPLPPAGAPKCHAV